MPHDIVVSIINFRTAELTLDCVRSVLADRGDIDLHVVVVDNASGDGSERRIAEWINAQPADTPVSLVASARNTGFSGGHNQGITFAEAHHYLLLNSDAILRRGFLAAILAAAARSSQAGIIAPRLEAEDGTPQVNTFRFHRPLSEFSRAAVTGPIARLLRKYTVALAPEPDPDEVEWASFACILLRQEMIDEIGPMDEGYFLYFEDAEYCLRARRAGWRIALAPDAVAVHYRGGSGPVKALELQRKRLPRYYYSSRTRFLFQMNGYAGLIAANLLWHLGNSIASLRRLLGHEVPPPIDREARDIWTNISNPLGPSYSPSS
jgi:GT2 family glycosyltransferase